MLSRGELSDRAANSKVQIKVWILTQLYLLPRGGIWALRREGGAWGELTFLQEESLME